MPSRLLDAEVSAQRNGSVVAHTHTTNYRFVLTLPSGSYIVNAKPDDSNYPKCSPISVQVPPGRYVDVSIECQSK